ncbi:hypothetical protein BHE74_00016685 [Ensete ventricosum]|nr:hypothetical protein BHE74_00016685 [Ensete ventricosum]
MISNSTIELYEIVNNSSYDSNQVISGLTQMYTGITGDSKRKKEKRKGRWRKTKRNEEEEVVEEEEGGRERKNRKRWRKRRRKEGEEGEEEAVEEEEEGGRVGEVEVELYESAVDSKSHARAGG